MSASITAPEPIPATLGAWLWAIRDDCDGLSVVDESRGAAVLRLRADDFDDPTETNEYGFAYVELGSVGLFATRPDPQGAAMPTVADFRGGLRFSEFEIDSLRARIRELERFKTNVSTFVAIVAVLVVFGAIGRLLH